MDLKDILAPLDVELKKVSMLGGSLAVVVVPASHAELAMKAKRETDTALKCGDYLVVGLFGMGADEASTRFLSIPKGIAVYPADAGDIQTLFFEAAKRLNMNTLSAPWVKDVWESIKQTNVQDADREDRFLKGSFYQFDAFVADHPQDMGRMLSSMAPADRRWVEDVLPMGVVSFMQAQSESEDTGQEGGPAGASLIEQWDFKARFETKVEQARATLRKFRSIEHLFTLPSISHEVIEAASDPMTAAPRMARIIEKDPVLTSRVLKVVNSAFYGFRRQIVSVEHAVVILGNDEVVNLAFSIAVHQIMDRVSPSHGAELWEHSLMVAHLSQWFGGVLGSKASRELYTIGLLHDFGKIVFLQKGYRVPGFAEMSTVHRLAAEEMSMGISHAEMGAYVAERWNLPEEIVDTLLTHHQPGRAKDMMLSVSVHLADAVAHRGAIPRDDVNSAVARLLEGADGSRIGDEIVSKRYDYTLKRVKTLLDIDG